MGVQDIAFYQIKDLTIKDLEFCNWLEKKYMPKAMPLNKMKKMLEGDIVGYKMIRNYPSGKNPEDIGFIMHELHPGGSHTNIFSLVVNKCFRREYVGTQLLNTIPTYAAIVLVPEESLSGQMFFKSHDFICTDSRELDSGCNYVFERDMEDFGASPSEVSRRTKNKKNGGEDGTGGHLAPVK